MPFYGFQGKVAVGDGSTPSLMLDPQSEGVEMVQEPVYFGGVRGTRRQQESRAEYGVQRVGGPLSLVPNAVELAYLLPKILGAAASGNTYGTAEVLPTIARYWKIAGPNVRKFDPVAVDSATFRAGQGGALELTMDLVGQTEDKTALAATFPSLSVDETTRVFMYQSCTISLAAVDPVLSPSVEITVNNFIDRGRFFNSVTLPTITAVDRAVTVSMDVPSDYWSLTGGDIAGTPVILTFTSGNTSVSFSMANVQFAKRGPSLTRGESFVTVAGTARGNSTQEELIVTLDSTP